MATYKTPGVYVEEISTLPASVAAVETAIPAFVGITEKAQKPGGEDVANKAVLIRSMVDFTAIFGGPPPVTASSPEIKLDASYQVISDNFESPYYLYHSMHLFYANGGGDCYVVSVGHYGVAESKEDYLNGLAVVSKEDDPTLLVIPDLIRLSTPADIYEVQQQMLAQCALLKDRFAVLDVFQDPAHAGNANPLGDDVAAFRTEIGMNNLKYGAAYAPYLKIGIPKSFTFEQIDGSLKKGANSFDLLLATDSQEVADTVTALRKDIADKTLLDTVINDPADGFQERVVNTLGIVPGTVNADFSAQWAHLKGKMLNETAVDTDRVAALANAFTYLYECYYIFTLLHADMDGALKTDVASLTAAHLLAPLGQLTNLDAGAATTALINAHPPFNPGSSPVYTTRPDAPGELYNDGSFFPNTGGQLWAGLTIGGAPVAYAGADAKEMITDPAIQNALDAVFNAFALVWPVLAPRAAAYIADKEKDLLDIFPVYKNIYNAVAKRPSLIPPSGAVVGAYAAVDASRGVWKAPANVSLNNVSDVAFAIGHEEQEALNVDVTGGKSINAIRFFKGKGHLIWGARTLAGNDNEWRYVPVRRLYIMAEESIKKATEHVVFEPNDANTWTRVKAMIGNFLTGLWRQGALAGAKPEEAFFVNVGLGLTMTPQDILEGRLIIEVGMAAVRPAEFIILRFMHKLQES